MAYFDAVYFLAAASGTGDFGVASAVQGYRTPADASVPNAAVGGYRAESSDLTQWEIGVFTYSTSGPTVARTLVLSNSLGTTAKINFTGAPNVGFVELSQDLTNASLLLTGTVPSARLGTGGAGAGAKFLADDQTFKTLTADGLISIVAYTSTQTVTIPAGATRCRVYLWGATGGTGGVGFNGITGGSGGGGYLEKYLTGLTPGNTFALTIGAAGAAGTSAPGAGGTGGSSILASGTQSITTLTAAGGTGSAAASGTWGNAAGVGGSATNGDQNISGENGLLGGFLSNNANTAVYALLGQGGWTGGARSRGTNGTTSGGANVAGVAGVIGGCTIEWYY